MNEKYIRKIAMECGATYGTIDDSCFYLAGDDILDFAKSIIEDCLNLAESHHSQNEDYADGIDSVKNNIKEYFGIE